MNLTSRLFVTAGWFAAIGALAGCASQSPNGDSPIPRDGKSMLEIYNGGPTAQRKDNPRTDQRVAKLCEELLDPTERRRCMNKAQAAHLVVDVDQVVTSTAIGEKVMAPRPEPLYQDYLRTAANEIKVLFPRLENPDIEVFIFPHLATSNRVPVPGYATVIPLYESVEYALPGERRTVK